MGSLEQIEKWAISNLTATRIGFEKYWTHYSEGMCYSFVLMKHDTGYWMVLGGCPFGYAGDGTTKEWDRINYGTIDSLDHIKKTYEGIRHKTKDYDDWEDTQ